MSVLFVKLLDGEDVIADVEETSSGFKLKNPARLGMTREGGLAMVSMNELITDKEIIMNHRFVVYTGTPDDEIKNAYNSKFGNGIVLAKSGLLT